MKILQLCNKFIYPPRDGGAIAAFNLTKAFAKLGCEVTVLAMNTSKHRYELKDIPEEIKVIAEFHAVDVNNQVRILPALWNLLMGRSYNVQRFVSSAFNDKLIELLHQKEFDVVQLEGLYLSPYVETIRAFSGAKIAMRAHNVEHDIWERIGTHEKNMLKKWYLKTLARQLKKYELWRLNKYDVMVPISEPDERKLKAFGCELPVHTCMASYDEDILKPDKSKMEFPSVFFLGALDWIPNIEGLNWFLENVWGKIHEQFPQVKLYIAGRNAAGLNLGKHGSVEVAGEVENAYDFMNSKGVMIVPLLSGSGMRVKIIEGMAMGKTIVSTSLGAEGIPCKDGQNILIADSADQFAEKISKCLREKMFFSIIGDNAHQFAKQRFGSVEAAKGLLHFYQRNLA